ncbi:MAG: metallophosphoesterase family protein [Anaerolineaceae bacterium]
MHTLVISDIHANATALEAVLADAGEFERVWCLGDVVGYGPDANVCVDMLKSLPDLTCIMGNHDAALLGFIELGTFKYEAQVALQVQARQLNQNARDYLELLEITKVVDGVTLAHGSPRDPIWEYILNASTARENFAAFTTQICLIGHTHIPSIFVQEPRKQITVLLPRPGDMWRSTKRFILNPGSVGQPRDRDPRASYVIWDDEESIWHFHRVEYDIFSVQKRILELGIPSRHAIRLSQGI